MVSGKVRCWKHNTNGFMSSKSESRQILYTLLYKVEYPSRKKYYYTANIISENMFAQCCNKYSLLDKEVAIRGMVMPLKLVIVL